MAELIPIANLRGPQGNKGDKGDIGIGFSPVTLAAQNLNTVTTQGYYRAAGSTIITKENNYPVNALSGILRVEVRLHAQEQYGPVLIQTYKPIYGSNTSKESRIYYQRTYAGNVWSEWIVYTSQRVDNTAGRAIYTWDETAGREQLVYGDTGKRIMTTLVNPIFGVTVAKIRRVTNEVEIQLQMNKPNGAGSGQIAVLPEQLPIGFRNQHTVQTAAFINSNPTLANLAFAGGPLSVSGFPETATTLYLMMKFTTIDAWPATLPGTPDTQLP